MDREKLKTIREALNLEPGKTTMESLSRNNPYWAYFNFLDDVLRKIIDALLEDDKPKSESEFELIVAGLEKRSGVRKSKHQWIPEELKAIKESIIHWRDNVSRLKLADELGMEIASPSFFAVWETVEEKQIATFSSKNCALCGLFSGNCDSCPLSKIDNKCIDDSSTYHKCGRARGNKEIISSAENMVRVLESLLE